MSLGKSRWKAKRDLQETVKSFDTVGEILDDYMANATMSSKGVR